MGVKTISQVREEHHESLKKQGEAFHEATDSTGGHSSELQAQVDSADVVFFEEPGCPYCGEAANALTNASIQFKRVGIREFRSSLEAATGKTSAPSVWIKGVYIGGCNDGAQPWHGVLPMLKSGKLQELV